LRPAWTNSLRDPIFKITRTKLTGGMAQANAEFKFQFHKKKKSTKTKNMGIKIKCKTDPPIPHNASRMDRTHVIANDRNPG
jgi:hypothetical protein